MFQLFLDFFSGRAKTRIYTTFLGWIVISHIDILFIAFFTDQTLIFEKTNQLKGEYIWSYVTHFGWWTVAIETARLVLAAMITYLMIWVIPKLVNEKSYQVELEIEYALRKMKVDKEDALNKKETNVMERQLHNIETEKKVATERAKLDETPEYIKWDAEFDNFIKKHNSAEALREIGHTVYAEGGNLHNYKNANGWMQSPTGVKTTNLELADTYGLVTFTDKGKQLALTSKGKYFIRKINELDNIPTGIF